MSGSLFKALTPTRCQAPPTQKSQSTSPKSLTYLVPAAANFLASPRSVLLGIIPFRRTIEICIQFNHSERARAFGFSIPCSLVPSFPVFLLCNCAARKPIRCNSLQPKPRTGTETVQLCSTYCTSAFAAFASRTQRLATSITYSSSNHRNPKSSMHSGKFGLMMM